MPLLAALIFNVVSGLAVWLGQWFARKAAWTVSIVAASTAAMLVFWAVVQAMISALVLSVPDFPGMAMVLYLVVPSNFAVVSANLLTAEIAFSVWRWHRFNLSLAA